MERAANAVEWLYPQVQRVSDTAHPVRLPPQYLTGKPSSLSLDEAIAVARDVRARQTYFTHLSHDLSHATLESSLPPGIRVSYDGLVLEAG